MANMFPVASVESDDSLIDRLNDKVDMLESKVELLEGKFDVWQKLVESILGTAQTAIEYDSNLIAVLAVGVATFSVMVAVLVAKDKEETMKQAIKEINKESEKVRLTGRTDEDFEGDGKAIDKTKEKQLISGDLKENLVSNDEE